MAPQNDQVEAEAVLEARRARVIDRYIAGETMREIAEAEDIGLGTVSRDVAAVRERWKADNNEKLGEWIKSQLARIDRIESHATHSYERSLEDAEKMTAEQTSEGEGEDRSTSTKTRKEKQGQYGDARFLRIMLDCVAERCKILGLYAPKRTDVTTGGEPVTKWYIGMPEDQV